MPPRKVLAIKLRSLGDTVILTAPLAELRRAWPDAEIHVATIAAWAPLLENHSAVDRVWTYERHTETASRAKAIARLALRLRRERFNCVVNFHASPSSATLAFATGSKIRSIHFHGHNAKNRHSTVIIPGKGVLKPIIERDMDTVRALGIHVPAGRLPAISLHGWEIEQADQRISKLNLPAPLLGIGLGATRPVKTWPIERFAALALEWCRKTGGGVLAVAGPNENDKAHAFLKSVDDALGESVRAATERTSLRARISAESNLPIRALAAILSRMSVFAGNDSGPRHVALATGTPTVTLFGPEHPFEWHPYPEDTHPLFFFEALACRSDAAPGMPAWCGLHECVAEEHKCMRMIGVNQVLQQCERVARPLILTR